MTQKIAILGAGSWGSALGKCLCENGHDVVIWGTNALHIQQINEHHQNPNYLKQIQLPKTLKATTQLKEALHDVDAILFAIPTKAMRQVAKEVNLLLPALLKQPYIIHASKGLEQHSHVSISQILTEELKPSCIKAIVVLSGPSHAEEVAKQDLTTITAACTNLKAAQYVQQLFMNHYFRVYTNTDVVGVELGAALKNIIAVGSGILAGLGYGDNARAALVTRGLVEISRFGCYFGAKNETFSGLSGVGDLIVTCTSHHSRNFKCGILLGEGKTIDEALQTIDMAVEGVWTTKAVYEMAQHHHIDMPITKAIYRVIYEQVAPKDVIAQLMARDGKSEHETL